ncbi:hypothetical protein ACXYMX_16065 [Sporosarcina sp. CAU 1771]
MDIKAKIEEIIEKVKSDESFKAKFSEDPVKAVEDVIGVQLPEDQINSLIDGVKAKVSLDKASGFLDKAKKLF